MYPVLDISGAACKEKVEYKVRQLATSGLFCANDPARAGAAYIYSSWIFVLVLGAESITIVKQCIALSSSHNISMLKMQINHKS